jgi:MFS family permease
LLLKERDFRLIVVAVGLSSFGDVLAAVALTIRVHDLTGSGLAVAALLLADLVAHVVLAPWAGMLVDRVETRRVLVAVSLGQAAVAVPSPSPIRSRYWWGCCPCWARGPPL